MAPKLKLTYFDIPGRAEPIRLLLTMGKLPFEDATVGGDAWAALKNDTSKTPFHQIPILEVDDKAVVAQSGAISRYVAKLGGLYPDDPLDAARTESADFEMADIWNPLLATFSISDKDAAVKARLDLLSGKVGASLTDLDKFVALSGGPYVLGSKLSWVDIVIFSLLSNATGGMLAGIPNDLLDKYSNLKALHHAVAAQPDIVAYYKASKRPYTDSYKLTASA